MGGLGILVAHKGKHWAWLDYDVFVNNADNWIAFCVAERSRNRSLCMQARAKDICQSFRHACVAARLAA